MITIESDVLRIQIDPMGAQLSSIYHKQHKLEYLWQKDPSYWKSSAPVVFPVIGKLTEGKYRYRGKEYELKSNGLIRYKMIDVKDQGDDFVEFIYEPDEEDLKRFPFPCQMLLRYQVAKNQLIVRAKITNTGDGDLHYFYAGHPGFNVPLYDHESCDDYYVEFEKKENMDIYEVCETGQLLNKKEQFFAHENRFFVRKNLFLKEALAFVHPISDSLMIKSIKNDHFIRVNFSGFDNVAVWSPYIPDKDLRFICIEPWIGHTEFKGFQKEWDEHEKIAVLHPRKSNTHVFSIEIDK